MHTDGHRFSRLMRTSTFAALCALFFAAIATPCTLAATSNAGWETVEETWLTIDIADRPAGWSKKIVSRKDGKYRTSTRTEMTLRRSDATVDISTREVFIERADGTPVRMERIELRSGSEIRHEWRFGEDGVEHIVHQHGRTTRRELPSPEGVWLPPRAAERYVKQRREAGAREITVRTIESSSGITPMTVTSRLLREDRLKIDGRERPVTVWEGTYDALPVVAVAYVSADNVVLKLDIDLASFRITMHHATREAVQQRIAERVADDAPEMVLERLVTPDRPIERVRESRRAVYRVRASNGDRPALPETGVQRVRPDHENTRAVIVTLNVDKPRTESLDDDSRQSYLAPSSMVDFHDDKVRELAHVPETEAIDPMDLARKLQQRVYQHITTKSNDTAFASASETVRSRRGDCTEHAVLLAALLRANDIPARVASGLVYVNHLAGRDHVFGWHMWTQAWIDGAWRDFDAVRPRGGFDAGYIIVSTSALGDDRRNEGMNRYVNLMANLEIDVIEVSH